MVSRFTSVPDIWKSIFEKSKQPILLLSKQKIVACNQAGVDFFELDSFQDCVDLHPSELSPEYQPDGQDSFTKSQDMFAKSKELGAYQFYWVHLSASKKLRRVLTTLTDISTDTQEIFFAQIASLNCHKPLILSLAGRLNTGKHKESIAQPIEKSIDYDLLHQHKSAIDVSAIVSKTDVAGRITYVNNLFCEVSGYSRAELLGNTHSIIKHPSTPRSVYVDLWKTIKQGDVWHGVIRNKRKDGKDYHVSSTINPIFNDSGVITEFISIRHDITKLYEQENILLLKNSDLETKLGNKNKLIDELDTGQYSTVAIAGIGQLSDIQRIYSHRDYLGLIFNIVDFLNKQLVDGVSLYRVSDNQFAFLFKEGGSTDKFEHWCMTMTGLFNHRTFLIDNIRVSLSIKLGLSCTVDDTCYNNASLALSFADKHNQTVSTYQKNDNLQAEIITSMAWTQKLTQAIKSQSFFIFGQQLVDINGAHYSTEVLMRLKENTTSEYISPFLFLEYARKAKVYDLISEIVIKKAFDFCFSTKKRISINLEQADILNDHTCQLILSLLEKTSCGELITFELVESHSLDLESKRVLTFIEEVKRHNCLIAIDDFGSGYSNFNYLTILPIDILKIDGSLIKDIVHNEKHFAIVKAIVAFSHALNIKVVAEYVASKAIFDKLAALDVDYFQGYYFDEPSCLES